MSAINSEDDRDNRMHASESGEERRRVVVVDRLNFWLIIESWEPVWLLWGARENNWRPFLVWVGLKDCLDDGAAETDGCSSRDDDDGH